MSFIASVSAGSCARVLNIGAIVERRDHCGNSLARVLEQIAPVLLEGSLVHPDKSCLAAARESCWSAVRNQQIASADVEFAVESEGHRKRRIGLLHISIKCNNAGYVCAQARRKDGNAVSGANCSGSDLA